MNPRYPEVADRAGERCEYCHAPERVFNFAFEVEHILPRSAGGTDAPDNLALACESCNLYKSNTTSAWDDQEGREVPLFDPRRDRWDEHFRFDRESGELRGLTPVGRGTVARLKMNFGFQLRARRHWAQLELYP